MVRMKAISKKLLLFLLFFLLLKTLNSYSQTLNRAVSFSISTNLIKVFMGIPNLELEYNITSTVSAKVFAEILVFDYVFKRSKHPGGVIRLGPYYHFLAKGSDNHDLQIGLNTGYAWSKTCA